MKNHNAPQKCGGTLRNASMVHEWKFLGIQVKAGDAVPCPMCKKIIKLRRPFNFAHGMVQIPMHNKAGSETH